METFTKFSANNDRVLQVLTFFGSNGEYGGPVRVAMELSDILSKRNIENVIIAGYDKNKSPLKLNDNILLIPVRALSSKYYFSSMWGTKFLPTLICEIKKSDIVHVHFARDLIPIVASVTAILMRKKTFLQTHGMIREDERFIIKFLDIFLIRKIFRFCEAVFALQENEQQDLEKVGSPSSKIQILPNGIKRISRKNRIRISTNFKVIFLARLAPVKNVMLFAELARISILNQSRISFEVYGPDEGDLHKLLTYISQNNFGDKLLYKGAISPDRVLDLFSQSDLLVLPSSYDPYPVTILEALSNGCSVLVMPSCGIASLLKNLDKKFVAEHSTLECLYEKLRLYENKPLTLNQRQKNRDFAIQNFSIDVIATKLVNFYYKK